MTLAFSVDLATAGSVVASLASVDAELAEVIVDLRWRVARLHSSWAGTTAGAHLVAQADWEASYAEMHDALVAMRRAVRSAADHYSAAGEANESMWGSVQ